MFKKIGSLPSPKNTKPLTEDERRIVDEFHKLYYRSWLEGRYCLDLAWLGFAMIKNPLDLWAYQEIIVETLPEVLIETGTLYGGSALFFASIFELLGRGEVITIDVGGDESNAAPGVKAREVRPRHPLINYVTGSSTDPGVVAEVAQMCRGKRVMVILDSDHHKTHVLNELTVYSPFVAKGCYMIVEDSNVNNHPVYESHGEGPFEAREEFMKTNSDFVVDKDRERFMFTCSPNGFLRKEAESITAEGVMIAAGDAIDAGEIAKALAHLEIGVMKFSEVGELAETLRLLKKQIGR